MGDCQLARDFAVTDWLTVISRYFSRNPDEGSNLIRKGYLASAIFMLYTRKINPFFSDIQNRMFDFEVTALDMIEFRVVLHFSPITNQPSFCCLLHSSWRYRRKKIDS